MQRTRPILCDRINWMEEHTLGINNTIREVHCHATVARDIDLLLDVPHPGLAFQQSCGQLVRCSFTNAYRSPTCG